MAYRGLHRLIVIFSLIAVFNEVLKRVTLANRFHQPHQKELFITLHQLMHTILDSKCKTLESYVHQTASESG